MTPKEAHQLLPAFADGELNADQELQVLEQMAADPVRTKQVLHQQQLKQACGRVMASPEMRCPDALRDQVMAMADAADHHAPPAVSSSMEIGQDDGAVLARIGRWAAPLAVAATLFIGALVALNVMNNPGGDAGPVGVASNNGKYTSDGLMTARLAESFGKRHIKCSLGQSAPGKTDLFPADVAQLDQALVQHVGQELDGAALDLSVLGYDYQLAGFCPVPGGRSVHVIYENAEGQSLSLWIKAYDQKPVLDAGVPYIPPQDHTATPMMVWREGDMVFYLVGDTMDDVRRAQPAIRLAMPV